LAALPTRPAPLRPALDCIRRGFTPVPLSPGVEQSEVRNWRQFKTTAERAADLFGEVGANVGVLVGPASRGLTIVAVHCPTAERIAVDALPETGMIFGSHGARTRFCYRTDLTPRDAGALVIPANKVRGTDLPIIEVLAGAGRAARWELYPGSVGATGEPIEWAADGEPARVHGPLLLDACRNLAAAVVLESVWRDGRRYGADALRRLLISSGWNASRVDKLLEVADLAIGIDHHQYKVPF
jgi:hypothetical protein